MFIINAVCCMCVVKGDGIRYHRHTSALTAAVLAVHKSAVSASMTAWSYDPCSGQMRHPYMAGLSACVTCCLPYAEDVYEWCVCVRVCVCVCVCVCVLCCVCVHVHVFTQISIHLLTALQGGGTCIFQTLV